jgi:hypothetical protein
MPSILSLFSFITTYWKALAVVAAVGLTFLAGYHTASRSCALEKAAAAQELTAQANAALQAAVAKNAATEAQLRALTDKTTREKNRLVASELQLRRTGEKIIAQDKTYSTCVVPASGLRYLRGHR